MNMSRGARPFSLLVPRSSNSPAVIDSHLHVWDLERADYPWLGPHLAPIDASFGIDDVRSDLQLTRADGVVLVQAADNAGDTENMRWTPRSGRPFSVQRQPPATAWTAKGEEMAKGEEIR